MKFSIQNAPITKRLGAFLLDLILLVVVATGIMLLVSAVTGFDGEIDACRAYCQAYASETHGVADFDIFNIDYDSIPQEQKSTYDAVAKGLGEDPAFMRMYSLITNLMLLIPSLGIFFAYAVTEFAVPLLLGNGQTVGKKVFQLAVMRCDGVKVSAFMLFARTLLGKFTVETMLPLLFIVMNGVFGLAGMAVAGMILLLDLILFVATKHRMVIHDAFAQTVVVDLPTQLIFNSPEELLAYKTRVAAEEAERAEYR